MPWRSTRPYWRDSSFPTFVSLAARACLYHPFPSFTSFHLLPLAYTHIPLFFPLIPLMPQASIFLTFAHLLYWIFYFLEWKLEHEEHTNSHLKRVHWSDHKAVTPFSKDYSEQQNVQRCNSIFGFWYFVRTAFRNQNTQKDKSFFRIGELSLV